MDLAGALADISFWELATVAAMALVASLVGGVAGYGTGALMPLVLVPIIGAEPVVPIIALSALLTNTSRAVAFRRAIDFRRTITVLLAAVPTCVIGAYGYTLLTSTGAMLVIGAMLAASVPLRRFLKRREIRLEQRGLAFASIGYGVVVGGTAGAGIILLSLLMAVGLEGSAVIATDAAISIVVGIVKVAVFGIAGVVGAQVVALALLIGGIGFQGAFLAKAFVDRMPIHFHTAILDAVVLLGGGVLVFRALFK